MGNINSRKNKKAGLQGWGLGYFMRVVKEEPGNLSPHPPALSVSQPGCTSPGLRPFVCPEGGRQELTLGGNS